MAARVCVGCTTVYAVGAPRCPHCLSTESVEQGESMPKITRHGGPSSRFDQETAGAADSTPAEAAPAPTPGEVVESKGGPFKPLPEVAGDGEQAGVVQTSEPDYKAWTVEQLKDQLDSRGLAKTGKKEELVDRLHTDDTARAAESDAE